jgi:hypothetical protein
MRAFLSFQSSQEINIAIGPIAFLMPLFVDRLHPPILDATHSVPTRWVDIVKSKPILHLIPHMNGEPALE